MDDFFLLLLLAQKGAVSGSIFSSTSKLSKELLLSQQSVSRKLSALKEKGLIELSSSSKGVHVKISEKGRKELLETFSHLKTVFEKQKQKSFSGVVQTGLGEGKYYLSFPQYQKQINEKLGFEPFPGTLNLKAEPVQIEHFWHGMKEAYISGFKTSERTFGGLKAFPVKINGKIDGALIFPDRSNNPKGVAEIIAPIFLRKKFGLKDGSKVTITEGTR